MNKREFLSQLEKALSGLPPKDVEGYLTFYSEMIDDRMEDGLTEGEAIQKIGPAGRIAAQITTDAPAAKTAEQKGDVPKRSGWKTALLMIGAPLRLSLLLAALAVILALYAALGALVITAWAVFTALICGGIGSIVSGVWLLFGGHALTGVAMIGAGLVSAGLSIFVFFGCRAFSGAALRWTKKIGNKIKRAFSRHA